MKRRILELIEEMTEEQKEELIIYAQTLLETQHRTEVEPDLCPKAD